jgi:hypothetical protein
MDPVIGRFGTMDPMAELRPQESPYAYCGNNPISRIDEDGEFWNYVIGAAVGGLVEYGSQVVGNVVENGFSASAFTDNIDYADIGVAIAEGALTSGSSAIKSVAAKTAIKVASSVMQNSVDATIEGGVKAETDVANVVKNTAIDVAGDAVGKLVPKKAAVVAKETTGNKAVKAAREQASSKGKRLSKTDADKARSLVSTRNRTARDINKTISESSGDEAGSAAAEIAKRKLEEDEKK